ncbi:MAG: Gfo/Idh/MocA family oxidoreductase [Phycisphaerae bacterium]|nr:Gfo/Idh/MocA family oxidoreductase [Phycisphaerae bacterium]
MSSKKNAEKISRRTVLAAGAAVPLFIPRAVLGGAPDKPAPSDRLQVAAVGIGGMGKNYIHGCGGGVDVVSLCDLDHRFAGGVFKRYSKASRHHDFRQMFDKDAKNFDALIVATPDHTHSIVLSAAIKLRKHIYCAKPVTHSIGEARKIRKALLAAKDLVTKTSAQSSGTDLARGTTELLGTGVIGAIRQLHIWCDHPKYPCLEARPKDKQTPPPGMDWDLWIGPAPYRPFHRAYHPGKWRSWWDFGTGAVGDMICHTLHAYFHELQLGAPTAISSSSTHKFTGYFSGRVSTPECQGNANTVTWKFPARGKLPPLRVHWYDGGIKPNRPEELDDKLALPAMGLLFEGEKGKLLSGYGGGNPFGNRRGVAGGLLLPEKTFKDFTQPPKTMPRCAYKVHYTEWVDACKTGKKTTCPIEFGCEMTEMGLLGALSLRARRLIQWDAAAMKVTNSKHADALVDPPYRDGWSL